MRYVEWQAILNISSSNIEWIGGRSNYIAGNRLPTDRLDAIGLRSQGQTLSCRNFDCEGLKLAFKEKAYSVLMRGPSESADIGGKETSLEAQPQTGYDTGERLGPRGALRTPQEKAAKYQADIVPVPREHQKKGAVTLTVIAAALNRDTLLLLAAVSGRRFR